MAIPHFFMLIINGLRVYPSFPFREGRQNDLQNENATLRWRLAY
jgi:hypothetical protein